MTNHNLQMEEVNSEGEGLGAGLGLGLQPGLRLELSKIG